MGGGGKSYTRVVLGILGHSSFSVVNNLQSSMVEENLETPYFHLKFMVKKKKLLSWMSCSHELS